MSDLRREEFSVEIAASLDEVWTMLTTDRGVAAWYGVDADIDPRPGGTYRVGRGDEVAEATVGLVRTPANGDAVPAVGTVALVDAPPSLLITGDDTTLLCDLEGDGDHLAIYVQAARARPRRPATRTRLLQLVAPATG